MSDVNRHLEASTPQIPLSKRPTKRRHCGHGINPLRSQSQATLNHYPEPSQPSPCMSYLKTDITEQYSANNGYSNNSSTYTREPRRVSVQQEENGNSREPRLPCPAPILSSPCKVMIHPQDGMLIWHAVQDVKTYEAGTYATTFSPRGQKVDMTVRKQK